MSFLNKLTIQWNEMKLVVVDVHNSSFVNLGLELRSSCCLGVENVV